MAGDDKREKRERRGGRCYLEIVTPVYLTVWPPKCAVNGLISDPGNSVAAEVFLVLVGIFFGVWSVSAPRNNGNLQIIWPPNTLGSDSS